jgi:hypothetical protein
MQNQDETVTNGNEQTLRLQEQTQVQQVRQQILQQVSHEINVFRQKQQQVMNELDGAIYNLLKINTTATMQQMKTLQENMDRESTAPPSTYTESGYSQQYLDAGNTAMKAADEGVARAMEGAIKSVSDAENALTGLDKL